ncbi:NUMOD3 domain-containing DNA-binding protein [Bacillus mycoides]|uniref:NUMOD3 domain-containing DNA-binding protein n=1 Tax=Bacillus mycoides TaxID=1405 RepID=UPI003D02385E
MIIYKATNTANNKVYIGLTTSKLEQRKRQHKHSALTADSMCTFHMAIRKYGWNNLKWEVVDMADEFEELCEKEKYWISHHNSYGNGGYNETKGGDNGFLGRIHSEETREKISKANKGKTASEETRKKMSETRKLITGEKHHLHGRTGEKCFNYGKRHSDDAKSKMSNAKLGKYTGKDSPHAVSIIQLTMDNELVAEHGSIKDASVSVGGKSPNIVKVCKGERKSAYGFKWIYEVEHSEI